MNMLPLCDHLDLSTLPEAVRSQSWRDRLAGLGLTPDLPDAPQLSGSISVVTAPGGMRLARLIAPAQALGPIKPPAGTDAPILMILTLRSRGVLKGPERVQYFAQNDLSVVDQSAKWRIEWSSDFKAILIELPRPLLQARLGSTRPRLPRVLGGSVEADMLRAMAGAMGSQVDTLAPEDLTGVEGALLDLVCNALLREVLPGDGLMTQVQLAHFRRVSAAVDAGLGQTNLSLAEVAVAVGLSVRYVQRLFELHGDSFSAHLRKRRLERSRADLLDSGQASVPIAQIAHRRGFASAAHFSRSFREMFGQSPKEFREVQRAAPLPYAFRGNPGLGVRSSTHAPAPWPTSPGEPSIAPQDAEFVLPARADTVHWGYVSRALPPALTVPSGAVVRVETLTQHGGDDPARFIEGDPGAESVFRWTQEGKAVDRRGAGPMDASIFGRGAGEGFGVHICTGPIHVSGARPGDVLEVEILDIAPRPCANPRFAGKAFGSNASAWWGYQYNDPLQGTERHETVTIFEVDLERPDEARAIWQYDWVPQTDPFGVRHDTMDYPGVPVDPATVTRRQALSRITVPARLHFGFVGVAPKEAEIVDTIPPGYFGGNVDNWRAGPGARIFLPVSVEGALLSIGDGHFSQGDGEVNGTGLEMSLTGTVRLTLHPAGEGPPQVRGLSAPMIETPDAWVIQSFSFENHLRDLGRAAQTEVYTRSTVDQALRNAFRQARRFLMDVQGLTEDEAHALMSVAVDFSVTQVADGNFGVHASIRKALFNRPET